MMVHLDNGLRFVANFKYEVKTNITKDPRHDFKHLSNVVKDTEDQAKFNFDSLCDQTMVGFVQDMSKSDFLPSVVDEMVRQELSIFLRRQILFYKKS